MHKQISSLQNPLIKELLQLQEKSRERKRSGLFVIEGIREIELALKGGYQLETVLFNSEIILEEELAAVKNKSQSETSFVEINSKVYQKIAYRGTTEGIIATAKTKDLSLLKLKLTSDNPLLLVAEAPEKPGNIGALLRTADAAKIDAVIIANPITDLYNPNIIRSSVGGIFTNTIATGTTSEVIAFLKENHINIYAAILQEAVDYHKCNYEGATAIVVGTEASGLTEAWRQNSFQNIKIPMQGEIDSMNVSVAAGILIFEANRQRDFNQ